MRQPYERRDVLGEYERKVKAVFLSFNQRGKFETWRVGTCRTLLTVSDVINATMSVLYRRLATRGEVEELIELRIAEARVRAEAQQRLAYLRRMNQYGLNMSGGLVEGGFLGPFTSNAYGPRKSGDAMGRPFIWQPDFGLQLSNSSHSAYTGATAQEYGPPVSLLFRVSPPHLLRNSHAPLSHITLYLPC
jgi:hypothetical protein